MTLSMSQISDLAKKNNRNVRAYEVVLEVLMNTESTNVESFVENFINWIIWAYGPLSGLVLKCVNLDSAFSIFTVLEELYNNGTPVFIGNTSDAKISEQICRLANEAVVLELSEICANSLAWGP